MFRELDFHAGTYNGEGNQQVEDVAYNRKYSDDCGPTESEAAATAG
jgi:hypothetical protein